MRPCKQATGCLQHDGAISCLAEAAKEDSSHICRTYCTHAWGSLASHFSGAVYVFLPLANVFLSAIVATSYIGSDWQGALSTRLPLYSRRQRCYSTAV